MSNQAKTMAAPLSRRQIRAVATEVRTRFGLLDEPYFPVVRVLEWGLPMLVPGFDYQIRTQGEMGDNHGLTDPFEKIIIIREDVYNGACDGLGRDRGTIVHEIFHAIAHEPPKLQRNFGNSDIPPYKDPEWQAKAFQGELLMYHGLIDQCRDPVHAAELFGVSTDAARYQWQVYEKDGLIKNESGHGMQPTPAPKNFRTGF